MGKYTDDEIRAMPKITAKIAADYLGISPMMVTLGMRNNVLPIGFAIKKEDRYSESWSYNIIPERLIAYNHGRINEVQVQNIEKNLNMCQWRKNISGLPILCSGRPFGRYDALHLW